MVEHTFLSFQQMKVVLIVNRFWFELSRKQIRAARRQHRLRFSCQILPVPNAFMSPIFHSDTERWNWRTCFRYWKFKSSATLKHFQDIWECCWIYFVVIKELGCNSSDAPHWSCRCDWSSACFWWHLNACTLWIILSTCEVREPFMFSGIWTDTWRWNYL